MKRAHVVRAASMNVLSLLKMQERNMTLLSVGTTSEGKDILVDRYNDKDRGIAHNFVDFGERDKFDALMAIEYLLLVEIRNEEPDFDWEQALTLNQSFLDQSLGTKKTRSFKKYLGIRHAFEARDYGKNLTHPHLRTL